MKNIFDNGLDYWKVAETVRDLYMSEGTISVLLDYERVFDEMDLYAFKNWSAGELVDGPDIGRDGAKKPKIIEKDVWLVQIVLPKYLINEIRSGSKELEDQDIDMSDLDSAYEKDLDLEQYQDTEDEQTA